MSNPPSPELNLSNLSDFFPYINNDDDEGFDECIEEESTEDQEQSIQVVTGTRSDDNPLHQDWSGSRLLTQGWSDNPKPSSGLEQQPKPSPRPKRSTRNNTTVKRNNRVLLAAQLSTIFVTNHR